MQRPDFGPMDSEKKEGTDAIGDSATLKRPIPTRPWSDRFRPDLEAIDSDPTLIDTTIYNYIDQIIIHLRPDRLKPC